MLVLLLLAMDPETAVDAERAFNHAAQAKGQWTAFREYMTDDAVVFTPQPTNARQAMPDKDPPIAVQWWAAESYVSCDGKVAVNTGPWVRPKVSGYFTTVWVRQGDGRFKWVMDGGDVLEAPRAMPEQPKVRVASCKGKPAPNAQAPAEPNKMGAGASPDGTLQWRWDVTPEGARVFDAELWDGHKYRTVVTNRIAAPK